MNKDKLSVFVHLSSAQDAKQWYQLWHDKALVGVNDPYPYGYHRAEKMGCEVTFSSCKDKSKLHRFVRYSLRAVLGFDFLHAQGNAAEIFQSDVVWTHTETQFLGVALLFLLSGKTQKKPKLIGQSVWLIDQWNQLSIVKRWLYKKLIDRVDVLTFHSELNTNEAKRMFPQNHIQKILYGIPNELTRPAKSRKSETTHVLSIGNDKHRDWDCLIQALGHQPNILLTIVSGSLKANRIEGYENIRLINAKDNATLFPLYDEATVLVVPLKTNLHAGGITVIQEGMFMGIPIIASDTGGLRDYFDDDCVRYIPVGDQAQLLTQVQTLAQDDQQCLMMTKRGQARFTSAEMGCEAYIQQHVELSRALLAASMNSKKTVHTLHAANKSKFTTHRETA